MCCAKGAGVFCNSENRKSKTISGFIIGIFSEFWASLGVQFW